jgi:hypothetical protein
MASDKRRIGHAPCRNQICAQDPDSFSPHPAVSGEILMAVIPHQLYSPDLAPCDFFLIPKMKLKLKECRIDTTEEIQAKLQRVRDRKGLQGCVPKMEETVGLASTCGRELL